MVEAYSYPLLVGFGETNIPRLEIMLVKYFSSEKSAGGDCEIEYENGSSTAVVRFRREEDQKNVLAKESHQISLEKGVLKLTVCLPTEEKSSQVLFTIGRKENGGERGKKNSGEEGQG
uniref:PAR14-like first RRM domain-containing protein n=1 Tax=Pundamilia nyererei TaxID=303518 RepID=A0A3B4EYP3_9CICH